MALEEYKRKRDFSKTPEPPPKVAKKKARELFFCVQKHLASHLHYDLRLEHNGVLLSWAVPKGPSLDPKTKRLAMHVEDHPFEYGEFEGVIPEGYGAGIVMLWDKGTWTPETDDVDAALKKGDLKFTLSGFKLKGSWVLVRTGGRYPGGSGRRFACDRSCASRTPRHFARHRNHRDRGHLDRGDRGAESTIDCDGSPGRALDPASRRRRCQEDHARHARSAAADVVAGQP